MLCTISTMEDIYVEKASAKKRQRSENWLEEDKILLKRLIKERVNCIENKSTDTNTNNAKLRAWNEVQDRFNAASRGVNRTVPQLKAQWGILKIKAKKLKSEMHQTPDSGTPPSNSTSNTSNDDMSGWLPELDLESNQYTPMVIIDSPADAPPPRDPLSSEETSEPMPNIEIHPLTPRPQVQPQLKRPLRKKICSTKSPAEQIAVHEIACRKELHALQMLNEQQKLKNLKLKQLLIEQKIRYYDHLSNKE